MKGSLKQVPAGMIKKYHSYKGFLYGWYFKMQNTSLKTGYCCNSRSVTSGNALACASMDWLD